jgi:hypothetical protein
VFTASGPLVADTIQKMKQRYEGKRDGEFAVHVGGHDAHSQPKAMRESEFLKVLQGLHPQDGSVCRLTICAGIAGLEGSFGAGFFLGFLVSRRLASLFPIGTC